MTRTFHIRDVLAITTGLSLGGKYFSGLQEIHDFLKPGAIAEKKANLLGQLPQLADCGKDLSAHELTIIKDGTDQSAVKNILEIWIARQATKYGEYFEISP